MKILVIGKGGREHALVWKLAQSPRVESVYCAPGNAGTAQDGVNVPIEPNDIDRLLRFAKKEEIGLTVVGPEEPLALGIVDQFQKAGLRIFGPTREAAQLEASKVFAKQLMRDADVPTAEFRICDHPDPARHYIETREYPLVVKADGLAAGKGVIVCGTTEEALAAIQRIMVREEFGLAAGRQVVIEKRLEGQELSILALVSGRAILPLPPTQDHKAAFDGDQGPNTGGMGAYCPAPLATPELLEDIEQSVLVPTVHALKRGRRPFRGVLYAGIMVTNQGPRVLEFNVPLRRPRDPAVADASAHGPARSARSCCGRHAGGISGKPAGVGPPAGGLRRAGQPGLSRPLLQGQGHHRAGGGGGVAGRPGLPRRHPPGKWPGGHRRRPRAGRDGPR